MLRESDGWRAALRPRPDRAWAASLVRALAASMALALGLAGLVAGCSRPSGTAASGTANDPNAGPNAGPNGGPTQAGATAGPAVRWAMLNSDVPPGMPLEPYYAALRHEESVLGPALEQAQAQREAQIEDEVARCMAAAGFSYYPQSAWEPEPDPDYMAVWQRDGGWLWDFLPAPQLADTREEVAQHGYGRWEQYADYVLMSPDYQDARAEAAANDPNWQYIESLSESALNAYYKTLEGLEPTGDGAWVGAETWNTGEGASCRAQAAGKFPDPALEDPLTDYVYQDLVGGMADIKWQVDDDPRTLAMDREWADCMAGFGFDVAEEHVVGDSGQAGVISGPIQAFYLARATGADGQVADTSLDGPREPPKDQRSLIGSQPEIDIALADFDCRVETDYMNRLIAIQRELETAFVQDNRTALEEMLAAIEANIAAG
ncbi:MAG: hypothetical protein LBG60_13990 [Bifidobacteriaceae bacterium]|jgi:hypothetical protein|nr:hypothetical protein [Bifidobacteriaceae bacterium]